ncbi:PAS domain-containing protein [Aestuariispira insulae]|uniref:histidine kinase n=1 Tax=Aestuariispira insulae TaxID=1461337 RepID=A0A3D9HQ92_9PROT|nr:PAS domain-containing protein [Aestuariispira insulae]RED51619.1 PAS domain S-box-containing protein [Aestuariispira insulae]
MHSTILLCGDEPNIPPILTETFQDEFDVISAGSSEEALNLGREHPDISVILYGLDIANLYQDEALIDLQKRSDAVWILLSDDQGIPAARQAVKTGLVDCFVTKPLTAEKIKPLIENNCRPHNVRQTDITEQFTFSQIMENLPHAVYRKDKDLHYLELNKVEAEILGIDDPAQAIGKTAAELQGNRSMQSRQKNECSVLATGKTAAEHVEKQSRGRNKTAWFASTIAPIKDEYGETQQLIGITRDVTEMVRIQQENALLLKIIRMFSEAEDLESAMLSALEVICCECGWNYGEAWLREDDEDRLVRCQSWYGRPRTKLQDFFTAIRIHGFEKGSGLPGQAWNSGKPVWWHRRSQSPWRGSSQLHAAAEKAGLKSGFAVPIPSPNGQIQAVLVFFSVAKRHGNQRNAKLVSAVISQLGAVLERKRAEEALHESENRFRDVVEATSDWYWETDENDRFIFVSDKQKEFLGYPEEAWRGKTRFEVARLEELPPHFVENHQAIQARKPFKDFEYQLRDTNGNLHHLSISGKPTFDNNGKFCGYRGAATDLTEQKQAEHAFFESETRQRAILNNAPTPIAVRDEEGRYIFVNRSYREQFLEGRKNINGKTDRELLNTTIAETLAKHDQDVMRKAEDRNLEIGLVLQGVQRYFQVYKFPLLDLNGKAYGICQIFSDLTERRRAEERLRHSSKMEAIGQLTGGVAHDFNNLLTVILGNLELLRRVNPGDQKQQKWIDTALKAAERGSDLTGRLLAFSRKQVLETSMLDLNDVITDLEPMLIRTLGEDISVKIELCEDPGQANLDENQLGNAILNLCVNARDAMKAGGNLLIETQREYLDQLYAAQHDEVQIGWYSVITVTDDGCGMSDSVKKRILEPFFTTKETGKGTGLGLSMVYGFVKQSGGHLVIYSEEGMGSTIRMYFPMVSPSIEETEPKSPELSDIKGGHEKILLVEDDPDVRELGLAMLTDLGYQVIVAEDGYQGIEAFRKEQDFQLVVTDVVMPNGLTGIEMANEIRLLDADVSFLFVSGYSNKSQQEVMDEAIEANWLMKPYNIAKLSEKVRQSLDHEKASPSWKSQ